jgi:hypothetical protein
MRACDATDSEGRLGALRPKLGSSGKGLLICRVTPPSATGTEWLLLTQSGLINAERDMVNLKFGAILLLVGAALFLLSDTVFGDSDAASYSLFFGLILFPIGVILTVVGIIQVLIAKVKERPKAG